MSPFTYDAMRWLSRHIAIVALAAIIAILGIANRDQWATLGAAALAECLAMFLTHVALFSFTGTAHMLENGERAHAASMVFLGVHILLGLVYAGSYFVQFSPGP